MTDIICLVFLVQKKKQKKKKDFVIKEFEFKEDTLYVSLIDIGNSQWIGGFISE